MKIRHKVLKKWPFPKKTGAITIYPYVFYRSKEDKEKLMDHEKVHIEQVKKKGWLKFYGSYIVETIKKGYKKNKYEVEAREKSDEPR